jgi:hypothetical protein
MYGPQTHYSGSSSGRDPRHRYGARVDGWHGIRGVPLSGTLRLIAGSNRQRTIIDRAMRAGGCGMRGLSWTGWVLATYGPAGNAKRRPGHYSVRLDTRLLVSQLHRSGDSGEERKSSGLLRRAALPRVGWRLASRAAVGGLS